MTVWVQKSAWYDILRPELPILCPIVPHPTVVSVWQVARVHDSVPPGPGTVLGAGPPLPGRGADDTAAHAAQAGQIGAASSLGHRAAHRRGRSRLSASRRSHVTQLSGTASC